MDKEFWISILRQKMQNFANKYYKGFKGATEIELSDNYQSDKLMLEKYYIGLNRKSDYKAVEDAETELRDFFFKYKPSDIQKQGYRVGIKPLDDYPDGLYEFKYKSIRIAFVLGSNNSILLFAIADRYYHCYQTIFDNYLLLNPKNYITNKVKREKVKQYYKPLSIEQIKAQSSWIALQDGRKND